MHADECESVRVSIIRVRVFVHSKEECVSERERVREIETIQVTNRCVRSETGPSRSSPKIKCTRKMTSVRVKEIIPYFFSCDGILSPFTFKIFSSFLHFLCPGEKINSAKKTLFFSRSGFYHFCCKTTKNSEETLQTNISAAVEISEMIPVIFANQLKPLSKT